MFSVIKKLQNQKYEVEESKGFRANNEHIMRFEVKPFPKEQDKHVVNEAYGDRLYTKLIGLLGNDDVILRRKAIASIMQWTSQKKEHIISFINAGVIPELVGRFSDADEYVMETSAFVMSKIASQRLGRERIIQDNFVGAIQNLVSQKESHPVAALNALATLKELCSDLVSSTALQKEHCIPLFIKNFAFVSDNSEQTPDQLKCEALLGLKNLLKLRGTHTEALDCGAMEVLTKLISASKPCPLRYDPATGAYNSTTSDDNGEEEEARQVYTQVLVLAVQCIEQICFFADGKVRAVQCQTVAALVNLLKTSPDLPVREASLGALMYITVNNEGKQQAIDNNVPQIITDLLRGFKDEDEVVLTNALKCVCNIAESPIGRSKLQGCVESLKKIIHHCSSSNGGDGGEKQRERILLQESAEAALACVQWTP